MTQHFSRNVAAAMVGEVINVEYLMQGEIFTVEAFVIKKTP